MVARLKQEFKPAQSFISGLRRKLDTQKKREEVELASSVIIELRLSLAPYQMKAKRPRSFLLWRRILIRRKTLVPHLWLQGTHCSSVLSLLTNIKGNKRKLNHISKQTTQVLIITTMHLSIEILSVSIPSTL